MKICFYGESSHRKLRCYLIESSHNTKILLDCGIPSNLINQEFIYNKIIPNNIINNIDAVFITHAHIDHWGFLPILIMKGFNNLVYMTEATKEIMEFGMGLYLKEVESENKLKFKKAFVKLGSLIHTISYGDLLEFKDFRIYLIPANHILGSSQIIVEESCSDDQILYTGDFNPKGSSLFNPIHIKQLEDQYDINIYPKAVIVETSKVGFTEEDFKNEELTFFKMIKKTFNNRGNVLIPANAIGDAQELITSYVDNVLQNKLSIPIETITIGSLVNVNKIYFKYKNEFRNPELVDIFNKKIVLKDFNKILLYKYQYNWDEYFNDPSDFGNKLFIATGGNLVGSAFRVYSYLKNHSKHLIVKPKRFETENCKASVLKLRIFSLHGNYDSMLRYINELEDSNISKYFLVHGSYENLKKFSSILNTRSVKNIIPKVGQAFSI